MYMGWINLEIKVDISGMASYISFIFTYISIKTDISMSVWLGTQILKFHKIVIYLMNMINSDIFILFYFTF